MKKLLALILCVMMFVAIIPTAAFAAYDTTDQRVWAGAGQTNKIVEALRTNINNMYGSIAVDNAVFNSVKQIDGIIKDLVDGVLKDYGTSPWGGAGSLTSASTLNDAIVAGLRSTIGGEISDYLNKHQSEYYTYDGRGNKIFNPTAYAGVYAKAASGALTSEKAVAGIQAYMLYAMSRSVANNVANQAHDLETSINGWEHWGDYGFGDMGRTILSWHVPGSDVDGRHDLDGILHNVGSSYASVLSALGQLGVNVDNSWTPNYRVQKDANGKVVLDRNGHPVYQLDADGNKIIDGYLPTFALGYDGWFQNVDGNFSISTADTTERTSSALINRYFWDVDKVNPDIVNPDYTSGDVTTKIADADYLLTVYEDADKKLNARVDDTPWSDSYNWAAITGYELNTDGSVKSVETAPVGVDAYTHDTWYNEIW